MAKKSLAEKRIARHARLRKRVSGTSERPRLSVFKSLKHLYVQVIDDQTGETLCAAGTQEKALKASCNREGAKKVGEELAKRAMAKGIKAVVFDRGGNRYHGVIANLADGAREAGLVF